MGEDQDRLDVSNLSDAELVARTKELMAKLGIYGEIRLLPLIEGEAIEVGTEDGPPAQSEDEQ